MPTYRSDLLPLGRHRRHASRWAAGIALVAATILGGLTAAPVVSATAAPATGTSEPPEAYVVAGTGTTGSRVPSAPEAATSASFKAPYSVATAPNGDFLVADPTTAGGVVIYVVAGPNDGSSSLREYGLKGPLTQGDIYVVANSKGTAGYTGDDGPATAAAIGSTDYPDPIALDSAGNIVVGENAPAPLPAVRVIAKTSGTFYGQSMSAGDIYTIAYSDTAAPSPKPGSRAVQIPAYLMSQALQSVGVDSNGDVVVDTVGGVYVIDEQAPGASETLYGLKMAGGQVYLVAGSGVTSNIAGLANGVPGTSVVFVTAQPAVLDAHGNIVVSDSGTNGVWAVARTTGTFYGKKMKGGYIYELGYENGTGAPLAVDAAGNIVVATGGGPIQVLAERTANMYGRPMIAAQTYTIAGGGGTQVSTTPTPASTVALFPSGTFGGKTAIAAGRSLYWTSPNATETVEKITGAPRPDAAGGGSLTVVTSGLPAPTGGAAYSGTVTASGGTGVYSFKLASGSLPPGLKLSSLGAVTGRPSAGGNYTFSVAATDTASGTPNRGAARVTLAVGLGVKPLPAATYDVAYSDALTGLSGKAPYTFKVTSGSLPPGLNLAGGKISGTPAKPGTYGFDIAVTDSSKPTPLTSTVPISLAVGLRITPASLPAAKHGKAYSARLAASGGAAPYAWQYEDEVGNSQGHAAICEACGLWINVNTGALGGTPTKVGTIRWTATVSDANGYTGSKTYSIKIAGVPFVFLTKSLKNATEGKAYSVQLKATAPKPAGTPTYTLAKSSKLPAGLKLYPAGSIAGTHRKVGTYRFTVDVSDTAGDSGSRRFTLKVVAKAPKFEGSARLPAATVGKRYRHRVVVSGIPTPRVAKTAGSLPRGLSLSSGRVISGKPTRARVFRFTLEATNGLGKAVKKTFTLRVRSRK